MNISKNNLFLPCSLQENFIINSDNSILCFRKTQNRIYASGGQYLIIWLKIWSNNMIKSLFKHFIIAEIFKYQELKSTISFSISANKKLTTNRRICHISETSNDVILNLSMYSKCHSFEYYKHINRENETRSDNVEGRNNWLFVCRKYHYPYCWRERYYM